MVLIGNLRDPIYNDPRYMRIDRKTAWGNPWSHTGHGQYHVPSRWLAVESYLEFAKAEWQREAFLQLDGKLLGCWCYPQLCHANALTLLCAEAKGVTRPWVLVTGEAPRQGAPIPPSVMAEYTRQITERLDQVPRDGVIVHGAAKGVDSLAHAYAVDHGMDVVPWPADWSDENRDVSGLNPGPQRNQFMLDHCPIDTVLAFHRDIRQSRGTKDMLGRAQQDAYDWEVHSQSELVQGATEWAGPIGGLGHP